MCKKVTFIVCLLITFLCQAQTQIQPIIIDNSLVEKITKLPASSSNAHELEAILGAAAACFPMGESAESWMCQWKGDLNSNRIENTINILFEAGMMVQVTIIDSQGHLLH